MNIIMYCQYVFGIGHLIRTYRIAEELAKKHRVTMICGGIPVKNIFINSLVKVVFLDPVMTDDTFSRYFSAYDKNVDYSQLSSARIANILTTIQNEKPDLFWVEGFPFARKKVRQEIVTAIEYTRSNFPYCEVVSSVRDVLIKEGGDPAYNARVTKQLNEYFDTLFIHSDPAFIPLEYTFGSMKNIKCKTIYTGYVTKVSNKCGTKRQTNKLIMNYGGSERGKYLVDVAVECHNIHFNKMVFDVFLNPLTDEKEFNNYHAPLNNPSFNNFSRDYIDHLATSSLSISLGGYNSVLETIANQVPAIIVALDVNDEQSLRIKKLKHIHPFLCIGIKELNVKVLNDAILDLLDKQPVISKLDINGASFVSNYYNR